MEIKKLYDEKREEKGKEEVSMPVKKFIKEHKNLIKILREGSRGELLEEAKKQEDELSEYNDDIDE